MVAFRGEEPRTATAASIDWNVFFRIGEELEEMRVRVVDRYNGVDYTVDNGVDNTVDSNCVGLKGELW